METKCNYCGGEFAPEKLSKIGLNVYACESCKQELTTCETCNSKSVSDGFCMVCGDIKIAPPKKEIQKEIFCNKHKIYTLKFFSEIYVCEINEDKEKAIAEFHFSDDKDYLKKIEIAKMICFASEIQNSQFYKQLKKS
jgi:hypothetical protein